MSNTRLAKRKVAYRDDDSGSEGSKSDDKTIPFLRRLRDMLREHNEVISFHAGSRKNGQVTLGRIVVHDRARVESEVLPRYFNHASFASLRRQLNYFSFTRIGKGRQRGATYINEAVMDLPDILRLKRRPVGTQPPAVLSLTREATKEEEEEEEEEEGGGEREEDTVEETSLTHLNAAVPVVHLPPMKKRKPSFLSRARPLPSSIRSGNKSNGIRNKNKSPTVVSPRSTSPEPLTSPKAQLNVGSSRVTLDLTQPAKGRETGKVNAEEPQRMLETQVRSVQRPLMDQRDHGEDILAGCQALLSISHALRQTT